MKARFQTRSGQISFELEGADAKDLFRQIAAVQEVFDAENMCGLCKSHSLTLRHRHVQDYDYYEVACLDCDGRFQFGQKKQGGALFPKRTKDGKELPNGGWSKCLPQGDDEDPGLSGGRTSAPQDEVPHWKDCRTPTNLQTSFDRLAEMYSVRSIPVSLPGAMAMLSDMFARNAAEHIFAVKWRTYCLAPDCGTTQGAKALLKSLVDAYAAITSGGKAAA